MSKRDQALRSLVKELGADYCIRTIDGEPCPYRDFGNGFNVEVSGMHTSSMRKTANIYLWFSDECIDPDYPFWRVEYGFSSLFFKTYGEAMAYCKGRFVDLDGKGV